MNTCSIRWVTQPKYHYENHHLSFRSHVAIQNPHAQTTVQLAENYNKANTTILISFIWSRQWITITRLTTSKGKGEAIFLLPVPLRAGKILSLTSPLALMNVQRRMETNWKGGSALKKGGSHHSAPVDARGTGKAVIVRSSHFSLLMLL